MTYFRFFIALLIALFTPLSIFSQTQGIRYQAVVRNGGGVIIANQSVGFQIRIIQNSAANTPIFTENHVVLTNIYGEIALTIGQGTAVQGTFNNIDWSKNCYVQTAVDLAGGTSFTTVGTTEMLNVPRALYAFKSGTAGCSGMGLCVKDFGAKGDNATDDAAAFQAALDAAAVKGQKVFIPAGNYRILQTLNVAAGVTILGEGVGNNPLSTPSNGSALWFRGTGAALRFTGHTSGMQDVLVYDANQGSQSANGIEIIADGKTVESLIFKNVLLTYFIGGTALTLSSQNAGGIAYCSFYDLRIRHAKRGIRITQDASSFTNSNTFFHGAISGGGFDYGILVESGNNNVFYGTIVEPGTSTFGHIVVQNTGEIQGHDIRIEGNSQPPTVPLVKFESTTRNSRLTGTYAGGLTVDLGNNDIAFRTGKATKFAQSSANLLENSVFNNFDGTALPFWSITGAGVVAMIQSAEISATNNVLKLTIPAGITANLKPNPTPSVLDYPSYSQVNFGAYIKTTLADAVYTRVNSSGGVTISQKHAGDGIWHFVGTTQNLNTTQALDPRFEIANTTGSAIDVFITLPTLNFGMSLPELSPKPLSSAGAVMNGSLSMSMTAFTPSTTFVVLSKNANVFELSGTQNVSRINHLLADRFAKGTVITLLFNDAGMSVTSSAYIVLKSGFTSVVNSSLTLISKGDGTWREVSRN
jgi:hypothetical protein